MRTGTTRPSRSTAKRCSTRSSLLAPETIPDDAGGIRQVQVRGENGEPKFDDNGIPVMRDALKISDSATIKARMNMIPQSNYPIVVATKEQYAAIPMREETIRDHAHDVLFAQAEAGRVKILAETYKEQQKKTACCPSTPIPVPRNNTTSLFRRYAV